jgi:hypothetical protein
MLKVGDLSRCSAVKRTLRDDFREAPLSPKTRSRNDEHVVCPTTHRIKTFVSDRHIVRLGHLDGPACMRRETGHYSVLETGSRSVLSPPSVIADMTARDSVQLHRPTRLAIRSSCRVLRCREPASR